MKICAAIALGVTVMAFAVPPAERAAPPRVFAHYMPWFRAEETDQGIVWDHWQWYGKGAKHDPDTVLPNGRRDIASAYYPLIGPYDSLDAAVLEYHLLAAKAAGIDGFIADWYGPDTFTDQVFARMVSVADRYGMTVALCLEEKSFFPGFAQVQNRGEAKDTMERYVRHALDHYARSPSYLKHGGRPVFLMFNGYGEGPLGPNYFSPEETREVLAQFGDPGILLVRGWFDPAYVGTVPGAYCWVTSASERETFYTNAIAARRDGRLEYVVGVANPGFDDSPVNGWGNGPRVTDRRGTQEYRDHWLEVLRQQPDAVQIVTWNDFQEGTTIEPAGDYDFRFVDLTEEFVGKFTGRPVSLTDNGWPLRLYHLRKRAAALRDERTHTEWGRRLDDWALAFSRGQRFLMGLRLWWLEWRMPAPPAAETG
ncbi:MAG: endo-1,3-alpha-glucanase family glycosylhydrolase [Verrucomicrobiota bacterium]